MAWGACARGACMVGVACVAGGMCGRGACTAWGVHGGVHGRGCAWQERLPLLRAVCILLECIHVAINFTQMKVQNPKTHVNS